MVDDDDDNGDSELEYNSATDIDTFSTTIDPYDIPSDTMSEGLGIIHPPYGSIVSDYIRTVFKIGTPKDW